jgi:hypothetical protein
MSKFAEVTRGRNGNYYLMIGDFLCDEAEGEIEKLAIEDGRDKINAAHNSVVSKGIADGLRMAAEMINKFPEFNHSDLTELINRKAKEVEEAKGEK